MTKLWFLPKNAQKIQSNCIFHLKGRGERALILAYLDSPMPEVILFFPKRGKEKEHWFCHIWIARWLKFFLENFFFYFGHIQEEMGREGQSWTESANFGPILFLLKLRFCKNSWSTFFRCLNSTSGENLSKIRSYLRG